MNSNYYIAKVFAKFCIVDLRINDIPLMRQVIHGDIYFERPINYLIEKSGEQILTVSVSPLPSADLKDKDCEFNIEIWRYDASSNILSAKENVTTVRYNSKENLTLKIPVIKRTFIAVVGYEIPRWSRCDVITAETGIKSMVVSFIAKLTDVLTTRQFERYAQMVDRREHDICRSLYLGDEEVKKRMDMLMNCLENGFELIPINGHKKLQYFGNRRVVSVVGEDMKSAIQFYNRNTEEILTMDLLLGIPTESNELSII